jgi:hypothetical protein
MNPASLTTAEREQIFRLTALRKSTDAPGAQFAGEDEHLWPEIWVYCVKAAATRRYAALLWLWRQPKSTL